MGDENGVGGLGNAYFSEYLFEPRYSKYTPNKQTNIKC